MDDLISRQAAIDALKQQAETMSQWSNRYAEQRKGVLTAVNIVEDLPSAQPEINCSEFPNNSDTISRQDAVSRRRLLSDLKELITAWEKYPVMAEQIKGVEVAIGYVELIPSAQPEVIRCTECKHYREYDSEYIANAVVVQCMADRYPISETIPDGWFCAGAERRTDEAEQG